MTWTYQFVKAFRGRSLAGCVLLAAALGGPPLPAQSASPQPPRRVHLILRDGSFQLVLDYRVIGRNVVYHSAERGGAEEIVPLDLIDLEATKVWEKRHTTTADGQAAAPEIDPELLKEEAARASLTPEIAPDLHLPELDSVLALDTFHSVPELVPLAQSDGQLNRNTAHNVLLGTINPLSSPHPMITLRGTRAAVQVHVPDPAFYVRIGDDTDTPASGTALTVDTHGAAGNAATAAAGGSAASRYVIVRSDVRTDSRVLASFSLSSPQDGRRLPEEVTETRAEVLPGGHWQRLTPVRPLDFGEFSLVEIVDTRRVNLGVWDFGVHPAAPENRDAIKPEPRHRPSLDRHRDEDSPPDR